MNFQELKNYDFNDLSNLGSAPLIVKLLLGVVVLALVVALGYQFDIKGKLDELDRHRSKETKLKSTFERKYAQSANLEAYKAQLAEMDLEFGTMIRQLPSKTEIPGLIVDISQTALSSGLNIELFKPKEDVKKGFYAEKPIEIRLSGGYEQMAQFSSDVAALPRIVTLHDLKIYPGNAKDKQPSSLLTMEVIAKTYRYLDESEAEEEMRKRKEKAGKK